MFGAEPQEQWTKEEAVEFEAYAKTRLGKCFKKALVSSALLMATLSVIYPFFADPKRHASWEPYRQVMALAALIVFLWFCYRWLLVYGSRQSSRETRQEYGEPQ